LLLPSADYAPLNVDVTTDPPAAGVSTFVRIMIGGDSSWLNALAGGVGNVSWASGFVFQASSSEQARSGMQHVWMQPACALLLEAAVVAAQKPHRQDHVSWCSINGMLKCIAGSTGACTSRLDCKQPTKLGIVCDTV
jgi:hypothetical protein